MKVGGKDHNLPSPIISESSGGVNRRTYSTNFFSKCFSGHMEVSINLIIQFQERLFGFIIKSVHTHLNCLCLVLEDTVSTDDMSQTTSADDFLNATIIERFTDDVRPVHNRLQKSRSSTPRSRAMPSRIFCSVAGAG